MQGLGLREKPELWDFTSVDWEQCIDMSIYAADRVWLAEVFNRIDRGDVVYEDVGWRSIWAVCALPAQS